MAFTSISDIVFNTEFLEYFLQRTTEVSRFFKSGIARTDAEINRRCQAAGFGGKTVNMPFWNDLSGDDEILTEGDVTVGNLSASQDVAVILRRVKAWGMNDLAVDLAGDDPMRQLADLLVDYWDRRDQKILFSVLSGAFADNVANDSSDLVLDISGEAGNAALLSKSTLLVAAQLLGDAKDRLTAIAMNSAAETVLSNIETSTLYRPSETPGQLARYNGRSVIVDDGCGYDASTGKAEIYLFGEGAVAYNAVPERVPCEAERQGTKNRDVIVSRSAKIMHLRGVKWTDNTCVGPSPTNAELAAAANWDRVYEKKAIRCVKLVCKIV
jgi:hypothetical protein